MLITPCYIRDDIARVGVREMPSLHKVKSKYFWKSLWNLRYEKGYELRVPSLQIFLLIYVGKKIFSAWIRVTLLPWSCDIIRQSTRINERTKLRFVLPKIRTNYGRCTVGLIGTVCWNRLSTNNKSNQCLKLFTKNLKSWPNNRINVGIVIDVVVALCAFD